MMSPRRHRRLISSFRMNSVTPLSDSREEKQPMNTLHFMRVTRASTCGFRAIAAALGCRLAP
ncbi:MAG: hypothetical protein OD918_10780, partial [Gammaproteobacteria bacterium]